jgi:hypothetical protein
MPGEDSRVSVPRLPLRTSRLLLRRLTDGDVDELAAIFGDARVMRYVGACGRTLDRAQLADSQERVRAHWERHGFGPLACVELTSGRVIGEAGLQLLEAGPDVELTYTPPGGAGTRRRPPAPSSPGASSVSGWSGSSPSRTRTTPPRFGSSRSSA